MPPRKNKMELIKNYRAKLKEINKDLGKVQEIVSRLYELKGLSDLEKDLNDIQ